MYNVLIQEQISGNIFDVSTLVHNIEHTTSLYGQPGKLTLNLKKDPNPNSEFQISCGSIVMFWCDKIPIFKGFIFNIKTDSTEDYKIIAYDQMRYLQNHDYMLIKDMSLIDVFTVICNRLDIPYEGYKILGQAKNQKSLLNEKHFADTSYFDMLQYAITESNNSRITTKTMNDDGSFTDNYYSETMKNQTPVLFFIRDNFGTLELNDINSNVKFRRINNDEGKSKLGWYGGKLVSYNEFNAPQLEPLIIGDESLLTDYEYTLDIDKETYNEVWVMYNDPNNKSKEVNDRDITTSDGTLLKYADDDKESKNKYRLLRRIENVKSVMTEAQIKQYAQLLLDNYSGPSRTMKIEALGFNGINAGDGFVFRLNKLGIENMVYVLSATHHYNADIHTMSLEVSTAKNMVEVLK